MVIDCLPKPNRSTIRPDKMIYYPVFFFVILVGIRTIWLNQVSTALWNRMVPLDISIQNWVLWSLDRFQNLQQKSFNTVESNQGLGDSTLD